MPEEPRALTSRPIGQEPPEPLLAHAREVILFGQGDDRR